MARRKAGPTESGGETEAYSTTGTRPAARRKTAKVARAARRGSGTGRSVTQPDIGGHLRQFIAEHPTGWGHDEWLALLGQLRAQGHDVDDPDAVGATLERERLSIALGRVDGIGAQRIRSLSERYGSLWNLRQAGVEDLARSSRLPRAVAERIQSVI
jgi:hypothetical protein